MSTAGAVVGPPTPSPYTPSPFRQAAVQDFDFDYESMRPDAVLWVVVAHFNPIGHVTRDAHFRNTIGHLLAFPDVRVITAEVVSPQGPRVMLPQHPHLVERLTFASNEVR